MTFAPSGDVVVAALRDVAPGGTVAINAIHLDRVPEFSYDLLWLERGLRSVANFTRDDAREFLELASIVPLRTAIQTFSLEDGNKALELLAAGGLEATAVMTMNVTERERGTQVSLLTQAPRLAVWSPFLGQAASARTRSTSSSGVNGPAGSTSTSRSGRRYMAT